MFARPRQPKNTLPPPKRRKAASAVDEVAFDFGAREEYLTGFHKRKVQRSKAAQEQVAKRIRQERLETRKHLRDERRQQVEQHVQAVNDALGSDFLDNLDSSDSDAWNGIDEPIKPVDHEAEYVDEDRYTLVTVEEVDVSKDGLHKVEAGSEHADSEQADETPAAKKAAAKPERKVRPRKKKFRYESKEERKLNRVKQRADRKAKAAKRMNR